MRYDFLNGGYDIIRLTVINIAAEAEPERAVRNVVHSADCKQYVTGLERARGTGAPRGSAYALLVKKN